VVAPSSQPFALRSGLFNRCVVDQSYGRHLLDEDDPRLGLVSLPVKHAGLAISNPVRYSDMNYEASILASSHLTAAVRAGIEKFFSRLFCSHP
jgi:hypothetical protein